MMIAFVLASLLCNVDAIKLKFRTEECMHYAFRQYDPFYGSFISLPDVYGHVAPYSLTITSPSGKMVLMRPLIPPLA